MSKTQTANGKMDAVFIRKSTQTQDDQGQKGNVGAMLKEKGVYVAERNWFAGTVSRRKVKANADFNRLMQLVEADKVGTVYVESQDRWGTGDRVELFSLLGILRLHDTRLYDLRADKDLTEKDMTTELLAFVGSIKSEKELQDIAYRSLRSRVNNFLATGSWPTGTHPYGYGKACHGPDGKLLWVWQPVNRSKGQVFYPAPNGGLASGPNHVRIPRKAKGDILKLVPSSDPDYVRAVGLTFDLYTRAGLSRRQISARLNAEGLRFNGGLFTHPDVTNILKNPAYVGDTHFGKVQTGELHTFDPKGLITEVKRKREDKHRDAAECLVKQNTHEPLVDRKTWELAQKKLEAERARTSYAPRNPAYYLKQLFVCGHCGKGLTGRTETDRHTGKRTVIYVCPTYIAGRCNGHAVACGYQRITHDDAERLLLHKIGELGLEYDAGGSEGAKTNLRERLARLGHEDEEFIGQWQRWVREGIDAFADYLVESYGVGYPLLTKLRKWAQAFYLGDDGCGRLSLARVSADLTDLREALATAEQAALETAARKLAGLRADHAAYTRQWVKATDEMQGVLKQDIERLEQEIREWEPRTVPLSQRLDALYAADAERQAEREKLLADWPALENREKGEALRRLFNTVTLFWDKSWHPAMAKPTRPRKTDRPGRYGYTLDKDRIAWAFAATSLGSSW
ncbi:MAG TPA: recombinase family protein [Gemmataceae bacterium]|jgi:hypothetical protein|nr:recombinase family protein [Gemmataceae bacterium]